MTGRSSAPEQTCPKCGEPVYDWDEVLDYEDDQETDDASEAAAEDDADGAAVVAVRFDPEEEYRPAEDVFRDLGLTADTRCAHPNGHWRWDGTQTVCSDCGVPMRDTEPTDAASDPTAPKGDSAPSGGTP